MSYAFASVPRALVADRRVPHKAKSLYAVLTRYANKHRQAWPSQSTLAAEMDDCSTRTVERMVAALRDAGWITVERRWPGGPNRYTLQTEALEPAEPAQADGSNEVLSELTPPDRTVVTHPTEMAAHTK